MSRFRWTASVCIALVASCTFAGLFLAAVNNEGASNHAQQRALLASGSNLSVRAEQAATRRHVKWNTRTISGIALSVVVSLTSSVDRECGAALYLVLFSVLCDLPLRNAMAMTAFTIACGSLAPAIAAMSEPHATERGVLALVDYPGALILLPTLFWGLSIGVVVNMAFPSWLLALLWVLFAAVSNAELLWSIISMLRISSKLRKYGIQLLHSTHNRPTADSNSTTDPAERSNDATTAADVAVPVNKLVRSEARMALLKKLCNLRSSAEKVESIALLYPAFYIPSAHDILEQYNVKLPDLGLADLKSSPSATLVVEEEQQQLLQLLQETRSKSSSKFTWRWGAWWKLQTRFEFLLIFKVVVLHLVTEAIRHHTAKPCSSRYWLMLFGVTGLVTCFLIFVVTAYSRRKLWRGPHWVDALAVVTQLRKQERLAVAADAAEVATAPDAAVTALTGNDTVAVAADMLAGHQHAAVVDVSGSTETPPGCWGRFKKRLPWSWVPAEAALSNISACNSTNQYKDWCMPQLLTASAGSQVIGILACALGLPAGPSMAHLLIMLGLRPHVVAGTSRFLVLCFCFGVFVAYIIAGNLHRQLAAAFAILNLGLAPLGMLLFKRLKLQSHVLLIVSLVMGTVGALCVLIWQLVPLLAHLAGTADMLPASMNHAGVKASAAGTGNDFDIMRFCLGSHY